MATQKETINVKMDRDARNGGGGMMRLETASHAVQSVGKEYIAAQSPQSSVVDLVRNLPSMNVATENTSGVTGSATGSAEIRGLTDSDMTIMVNGGPVAGFGYVNEAIDSEDMEAVNVTPGSSSIDLPVTSSAAGVMNVVTHTPSHKFGGMVDFSYGSNNLSREFIRLESGDILNSGVRSYISFSNTHARSWMGAGINERKNVDIGIQKDFDNGSNIKLFASYDRTDAMMSNYPTADEFYEYKHTGNGYGRSASFDPSNNDYWRNNTTHWNEFTMSAPMHFVATRRISFDFKPYLNAATGSTSDGAGTADYTGEYFAGNGASVSGGQPLTYFFNQNNMLQIGAVASVTAKLSRHNHLTFGYWYEHNDQTYSMPLSVTDGNGASPSVSDKSAQLFYASGQPVSYGMLHSGYELNALFIEDTEKYFRDRLIVSAGLKYAMIDYWAKNTYYDETGKSYFNLGRNSNVPMPHFSVSYRFNPHHQIYINAEGDFRQPAPQSLYVASNVNQLPKNQYSIKEELGYRYNDKHIIVDLSFFNYNITDRLLNVYEGAGQTATINGGNQTSRGFDLMVGARPIHGFSPYASIEYLNATMDSNIPLDGSYMPTKGHNAVMAPHVLANFGLTYTYKGFFSNFGLHYASSQSTSLAGDERMPGYVSDTLALGYHFHSYSFMQTPTFRLNFTNLTGSIVRTGTTGVTTNANSVRLMNGMMSDPDYNSPNTYIVEPRFSMTGSISTSF
ncbi:TonB-dependent receptor [Komagataeibacter rhaeticus]